MGTKLLTIDTSSIRMKLREPLLALCLLALSVGAAMVIPATAQQAEQSVDADKAKAELAAVDEEWREAFLRELSAVATKLERQRKFNEMLRDRVDILNHRIETLESENKDQAARLKALGEVEAKAQAKKDEAKKDEEAADNKTAQLKVPDASTPDKDEPEQSLAPAPKNDPQQDATAPKEEGKENKEKSAKRLPDDFSEFLDMGEAMMRRFFGVVKEFRQEFEDNRV